MTFSGMWTAAHRIARAISGLLPSGSFVALSGKNSTNWYLAYATYLILQWRNNLLMRSQGYCMCSMRLYQRWYCAFTR